MIIKLCKTEKVGGDELYKELKKGESVSQLADDVRRMMNFKDFSFSESYAILAENEGTVYVIARFVKNAYKDIAL